MGALTRHQYGALTTSHAGVGLASNINGTCGGARGSAELEVAEGCDASRAAIKGSGVLRHDLGAP